MTLRRLRLGLWVALGLVLVGWGAYRWHAAKVQAAQDSILNQTVMPASAMGGTPAPGFTLTNQFGQPVSLGQFHGKEVVLAFVDSECTTVCPLTTVSMMQAEKMLGPGAASQIQLLGVNSNPQATTVADVKNFSVAHGMLQQWDFLTGSSQALASVWKAYAIYVAIQNGAIDHTPALYVIGPHGNEQWVFMTQLAYASVGRQTEILAKAMARVLPHPTPQARALIHQPMMQPPPRISLKQAVTLPTLNATGQTGSITLKPGQPYLLVFFASWLSSLSNVPQAVRSLSQYQSAAAQHGWPPVVLVDEATTEPSASALPQLLRQLGPATVPVAIDKTGALAEALGVQDLSWYSVVGSKGTVLWSKDASSHWLSTSAMEHAVAAAIKK